jgi:hypothetical protein
MPPPNSLHASGLAFLARKLVMLNGLPRCRELRPTLWRPSYNRAITCASAALYTLEGSLSGSVSRVLFACVVPQTGAFPRSSVLGCSVVFGVFSRLENFLWLRGHIESFNKRLLIRAVPPTQSFRSLTLE